MNSTTSRNLNLFTATFIAVMIVFGLSASSSTFGRAFAQSNADVDSKVKSVSELNNSPVMIDSSANAENSIRCDATNKANLQAAGYGSADTKTLLLADGSTGEDEPILQKFIKKLGSIIWG